MNNIIIVTGASKGIGLAISKLLNEKGFELITIARSSLKLDTFLYPHRITHIQADLNELVLDRVELDRIFEGLNIIGLINNAGINEDGSSLDFSLESWNSVINTNLTSPALLSQYVVRKAIINKTDLSIVNISSQAKDKGSAKYSYASSKAGLHGLTVAMAKDLGKYKIRVNSISPSLVKTNMTKNFFESKNAQTLIDSQIPLQRCGEPIDIAELALFLISNKSSYITGQDLQINGGYF